MLLGNEFPSSASSVDEIVLLCWIFPVFCLFETFPLQARRLSFRQSLNHPVHSFFSCKGTHHRKHPHDYNHRDNADHRTNSEPDTFRRFRLHSDWRAPFRCTHRQSTRNIHVCLKSVGQRCSSNQRELLCTSLQTINRNNLHSRKRHLSRASVISLFVLWRI